MEILYMLITETNIHSIPEFKLDLFTHEDCSYIKYFCKHVLYTSRNENNSNEVGLLLDSFNFNNIKWFKGSKFRVSLKIDWTNIIDRTDYTNRYIFIHNHPNCRGFSLQDISSFLANRYLFCIIVVQNNGSLHTLHKECEADFSTSKWFKDNFSYVTEFYKVCEALKIYYK